MNGNHLAFISSAVNRVSALHFHYGKMAAAAFAALSVLKETMLGWTWPPEVNMGRRAILGIFSGLEAGSLLIIDEVSGMKHTFGQSSFDEDGNKAGVKSVYAVPNVDIVVKRNSFLAQAYPVRRYWFC
jgi:hypothetical protein